MNTTLQSATCFPVTRRGMWTWMRGLLLLVFLAPLISSAQGNQANMWYFGYAAGVDFNQGSPPAPLTDSQLNVWDVGGGMGIGAASIADSLGQLQFYSDGIYIMNREHSYMLNAGKVGDNSTSGALIVPQPGHPDIYYFFNTHYVPVGLSDYLYYMQYSVIDMSLDDGRGAIIPGKRCITLYDSTLTGFSAVYHANKKDIWVLTHRKFSNKFYAYLVTSEGMDTIPVESGAGTPVDNIGGLIKFSPDGKKVGITVTGSSYTNDSYFEILDFDNETGLVSDNNLIHKSYDVNDCVQGLEFSPNSSVFYCNTCGSSGISQFNLKAGTPDEIFATEVFIDNPNQLGNLQLGPDGKIYFAPNIMAYLGVINKPNNTGTGSSGCDYDMNGVDLLGRRNNVCLPTFIQTYFKDPEFKTIQNCFGEPTQFIIDNLEGVDSVKWKFKDFANMPNDTSTLFSPSAVYIFRSRYLLYPVNNLAREDQQVCNGHSDYLCGT